MSLTRLAFALVSLALVLAVVYWEREQKLTPGPLHPVHAAHAELTAPDGCPRCHGGGQQAMADACVECHAAIGERLMQGAGLHGALPAADAARCGACHREHAGERIAPITADSWQRAGVADATRYRHEHVPGYALAGVHAQLACESCHPRDGNSRHLGLDQTCTACHEDVHGGHYGDDCAQCHGQQAPFAQAAEFRHDERFPLAGAHAGRACRACHEPGSDDTIALRARESRPEPRRCADCHASPHRGDRAAGSRFTAGDCRACHDTAGDWTPRVSAAQHARFGPELEGSHRAADCRTCHAAPLPELEDCRGCHESPHRPEFLQATGASGCVECHAAADPGFGPPSARLSAAGHSASGFDLRRPHADLACAVCHRPGAAWAARFPGRRAVDCAACHADPHAGQFAQACVTCHRREAFSPSLFDEAAHAHTAFPLTGAHLATACAACHQGNKLYRPLPTACAACHTDPHGGIFDGPGRPARLGDRTGCARCHVTERFDQVRWSGEEHRLWTGHALQGAHAGLACTQCHRSEPASSRRLGPAPKRCDQCHLDPHAGQFHTEQGSDCARCHTEQRFLPLQFDHQRDARFALDATHRGLACSACHKSHADTSGRSVVRWRPLGITCADCHDSRRAGDGGRR